MKKSILFIGALLFVTLLQAQTAKFFLNRGAVNSVAAECSSLKNIKVTFPVPANVSTYDSYIFSLQLSSLDVPAQITFDKAGIARSLAGKASFSAEILKDDGTSDFSFGDADLKMKDLCFLPRIWQMEDVKVDVNGTGYHITGSYSESVWDDHKQAYVTNHYNNWDEGTRYATGAMTITQLPLSAGISDATDFIHIAATGGSKIGFGEPEVTHAVSTISISDESLSFPMYLTYAYYNAADYSKTTIESAILKVFSGGESDFFSSSTDAFSFMRELPAEHRIPVNNKTENEFHNVMLGTTAYDQISFRNEYYFKDNSYDYRLKPGAYITYYVAQVGNYVVVINSYAEDVISKELESAAFNSQPSKADYDATWFTWQMKETDMKNIDEMNSKIISGTSFNVK